MNKVFFFTCFLLMAIHAGAQSVFLLKGTVVDEQSNRPMAGVTVYSKSVPHKGVSTDDKGRFTLSLPAGKHTIVSSFIGYSTLETNIDPATNPREVRLVMSEDAHLLQEVVVTSKSLTDRVANPQIGVERIEMEEMAKIPALFGERDIIKSIQLLPGVKSDGDGSSGFQVRGGTSSQNHILLDDATIYNAGHLMGIFSTFNDEALSNASLYKGQIPAQFGGGTSSVFDIMTKNGNTDSYRVSGSVGLLAAKLSAEGPIAKDKLSFFASARRTYFDVFLNFMDDYKNTTLNFYDINAKVNYRINDKNLLFLTVFSGKDNMGLENMMSMKWGNQAANARWFHQFNPRHYSNTSFFVSSYSSDNSLNILDRDRTLNSHINHVGVKQSFNWRWNEKLDVKYGLQSVYTDLKSADWNIHNFKEKEKRNAWENSAWLNNEWKATDELTLLAGIRLNAFSVLGGSPYYKLDSHGDITETLNYKKGKIVKTYFNPEPRISVNYRITPLQSIKAGYSLTSQHIHALRNGTMSLPFDRYTMSSNILKPQTANQVSLGYSMLTKESQYEFSLEGYYKTIKNVLDYKDGKSFSSEVEIERLVLAGRGRAYGMEFYAKKNMGCLTGWLSYTISWSDNKIPGINNGKWYTAGNDRRHDVSIVGMYQLSHKWHLAATWVYNTGQALTVPSAKYDLNGETVYYYAERNGYRAPAYHRLDVSATYTKKGKRVTQEWVLGCYNAYHQYNPFIISFETDENKPSGTKAMQYSLFGMIPSISYNFKF